jgi:addiction module RelE/StbE family toxin
MSILWSPRSLSDIRAIRDSIAQDNPSAALNLINQIFDSSEITLATNPQAGRPGRVEGTREWVVHKHYIVVYRIAQSGQVQVATVRHTSRGWPDVI